MCVNRLLRSTVTLPYFYLNFIKTWETKKGKYSTEERNNNSRYFFSVMLATGAELNVVVCES